MSNLRALNVCLPERKKNVLNYEVQSLFIEVRGLYKISTDDQDMNSNTSFCEKIEKGVPYRHPKAVGPNPKTWKFGPFRVLFGTPKVSNWPLDTKHSFLFGCCLDFSSRVF